MAKSEEKAPNVRDVHIEVRISACQPITANISDIEDEVRQALDNLADKYEVRWDVSGFEEYYEEE